MGLYNFIGGFGWTYKRGGGGIEKTFRNDLMKPTSRKKKTRVTHGLTRVYPPGKRLGRESPRGGKNKMLFKLKVDYARNTRGTRKPK